MKKLFALLLLIAVCGAGSAQSLQPIPLPGFVGDNPEPIIRPSITLDGASFHYAGSRITGIQPYRLSPTLVIDAPITTNVLVGGWGAGDSQHTNSYNLDSVWLNLHATALAVSNRSVNFGVTGGILTSRLNYGSYIERGNWTELGFVTSAPLRKGVPNALTPMIGASLETDIAQGDNDSSGYSYSTSIALPINSLWSFTGEAWQIALDHASKITILGIGLGYRL